MSSKTLVDKNKLPRSEGANPVQSFLTMLWKKIVNWGLIAHGLPKMTYSECFGGHEGSPGLFWAC